MHDKIAEVWIQLMRLKSMPYLLQIGEELILFVFKVD
jgi:hypothetical protein